MSDLRSFLAQLESKLHQVDAPIDPITQAGFLCSESNHPILFNHLEGFPGWKLADILVSTRDTQAIALGTTPDNVVRHLVSKIYGTGPGETKLVDGGPCKEVKYLGEDADIRRLPIPIHSTGDGGDLGGRYLGSGLTITKDPDTGVQNVAIVRTHIRDNEPRKVGFWMAARHNWAHYKKYESRNEKMPMAYAIGTHPAYEIMANYSGPHDGYDELALGAGALGETLEMVKCETVDLEVPAHAEIVIEGFVPPHIREPEGPFGEFTGFQGGKIGLSPVMEITAITHRRNPIFRHMQATVFTDHQPLVGLPMEAAIYQRAKDVQGGIKIHDVYVPPRSALFTTIIKMTAQWDGQATAVGLAALTGPNLHPKIAILVDEDVDIYDADDVLWAITQRVNPQTEVTILANQRIHPLDQSVPPVSDEVTVMRLGGKMVIDATKPPTWRQKDRDTFTRVEPMGAEDTTLDEIVSRIRELNHRTRQGEPPVHAKVVRN